MPIRFLTLARMSACVLLAVLLMVFAGCRKAQPVSGSGISLEDSLRLEALSDSAYECFDRGEFRTSLRYANEMEDLAGELESLEDLSCSWGHQIACYQSLGLTDSALVIAHLQIPLDSILGNLSYLASDYGNLGYIYLSLGEIQAAKHFALLALECEKKVADSESMGVRYGLLCEVYTKLGMPDSSIYYGRHAYAEEFVRQDTIRMARRLAQMADSYLSSGDKAQAEKNYRQAIPMFESHGEIHSLIITYNQLASLLLDQNKPAEAIVLLEKAESINKEDANLKLRSLWSLYRAYRSLDVTKSMDYLEQYNTLKENQRTQEIDQMVAEYKARYETAEKDLKLLARDESLRKMRYGLISSLVLLFLLGVIAIILGYLSRIRKKHYKLLNKLDTMRSSFYTNLTHEFRTPLSIILGLAEKYTKENKVFTSETIREDCNVIQRQGNDLLTMVNQMLDYAKISSEIGNKDWRHGELQLCVGIAVDAIRPLAQQKNISLVYDYDDARIESDFIPLYIDKLVRNLLANSVKYSSENGCVKVQLRQIGDKAQLAVSDNGIGIPSEDMDYIFLPYYQGHAAISTNSTGVGLSLVKQVVDAHNGTIEVVSKEGVGTTFTITIPISASGVDNILDYSGETGHTGNKANTSKSVDSQLVNPVNSTNEDSEYAAQVPIILVVEDNDDLRKHMVSLLSEKYRVESAHDGLEALDKATNIIPDIILTDLMMPRMDGNELCNRLRQNPLLEHIPVIMVTAKDTEQDRLTGLKDGAVEYITKPFVGEELKLRVDNLMSSLKAQRLRFEQAVAHEPNPYSSLAPSDATFMEHLTAVIFDLMSKRELSTESVAQAMEINTSQLRRKVNAVTGENTNAYIQRVRMGYARQLLLDHPEMSISDVAKKCGYDETSHFSRAFKTVFDITPSQVRK